MGDPLGSPRVAPLFANHASRLSSLLFFRLLSFFFAHSPLSPSDPRDPWPARDEWGPRRRLRRVTAPSNATNDRKRAENHPKWLNFGDEMAHNGASPVVHVVDLGESFACICSSTRNSTRAKS
ncbi:UNVERIFIED_CONTAM: hypothetical protein Slati_2514100 [Sesamum latifolium]|uniref:Uncharacterized protein n=1 Tax=Sesamum latifolium TaxID=2727402 RepID=A0AAW2WI23_9LAMI